MAVDEINGFYIETGAACGAGTAIGEYAVSEDYKDCGDGRDAQVKVEVGEAALSDKGRRGGNRKGRDGLIERGHALRPAAAAVSAEEEVGDENRDKGPCAQACDPEGYLITGHYWWII